MEKPFHLALLLEFCKLNHKCLTTKPWGVKPFDLITRQCALQINITLLDLNQRLRMKPLQSLSHQSIPNKTTPLLENKTTEVRTKPENGTTKLSLGNPNQNPSKLECLRLFVHVRQVLRFCFSCVPQTYICCHLSKFCIDAYHEFYWNQTRKNKRFTSGSVCHFESTICCGRKRVRCFLSCLASILLLLPVVRFQMFL